jgi:hypothetical protein
MKRSNSAVLLALGLVIGLGTPAWAQDKTDFTALQTTLKPADKVTLTTVGGDKIKGKMLEVSADRIVLQLKGGPRSVDAAQIQKVQKRKNGVLLGALIGVGSMIPVSIGVSTYSYNEGGGAAVAFIPIAVGLGAGIGIDAAIGSNKTLYERQSGRTVTVAPMFDSKGGVGGRVAFKF